MPLLFFQDIFAAVPYDDMSIDQLIKKAQEYEHGEGTDINYDRAIVNYCHAARRGSLEASYQLGWMYFNGRGVEKNDVLAARWFQRAAKNGDLLAKKMLSRLPEMIRHVENPKCLLSDGNTYLEPLQSEPDPSKEKIMYWVERLAKDYDLKPELVLAVIEAESNFQVNAHSEKNAKGLMQLIPDTAKRFNVKNIWDPLQNIQGGMAYLQWLHSHFQNNLEKVLAAYNAGENVVKRYGGIPPYRETKEYVKKTIFLYQRNLAVE